MPKAHTGLLSATTNQVTMEADLTALKDKQQQII